MDLIHSVFVPSFHKSAFPKKEKTDKKLKRQKKKTTVVRKRKLFNSSWQFITEKENKLGEHATGIKKFRDKGQLKIENWGPSFS